MDTVQNLAAFLPRLVQRRAQAFAADSVVPVHDCVHGALIIADVSGFTPLAEDFAARGAGGTDELTQRLNDFFGGMVSCVASTGGEVLNFAGDALTAFWPASNGNASEAVTAASHCALSMQRLAGAEAYDKSLLGMKIGVAAGDLQVLHLGGESDQWMVLLAGAPILQASAAERRAQRGEIVLAPSAVEALGKRAYVTAIGEGYQRLRILEAPAQSFVEPEPLFVADTLLRMYLPKGVWSRLQAGQSEWLAEIRTLTIMFVRVASLNPGTPKSFEQCQAAVRAVQRTTFEHGGNLLSVLADERGMWLIGVFGLPDMAHEDDPMRALRAGLSARTALSALGHVNAVGIATGRAVCGPVGNATRREYTVIGDTVNLSARLAQTVIDDIICDETTFKAAEGRMRLEALPPMSLKGKRMPMAVYRALGKRPVRAAQEPPGLDRTAERAAIYGRIHAVEHGVAGTMMIMGEAGLGKSHLMAYAAAVAHELKIQVLRGEGDAVEGGAPLYPWRQILRDILDPGFKLDGGALTKAVMEMLGAKPELAAWASLLNVVLPLECPGSDMAGHLPGDARAQLLRDLVAHLVEQSAAGRPLLIMIEDAHWMDSLSWALAESISRRVPNVLLAISLRPMPTPHPDGYAALLDAPGTLRLVLRAFGTGDIDALLRQVLGVASVERPALEYVHERTGGHPYFTEEVIQSLRQAGILFGEHGVGRLTSDELTLKSLKLPESIDGMINSRVDRLEPREQLCLKTASVLGRGFARSLLEAVYPVPGDRPELESILARLCELGFLMRDEAGAPDAFDFKHTLIRDRAYASMTRSQRGRLHREAARAIEDIHRQDRSPAYAALAYHWSEAEDLSRALTYLDLAADHALANYANHEAIAFFIRAQRIAADRAQEVNDPAEYAIECARRERRIALAYYNTGAMESSTTHLTRALNLISAGEPNGNAAMVVSTLGAFARQFLHHQLRGRVKKWTPRRDDKLHEAALCYDLLSLTHFFTGKVTPTMRAVFKSVQLAERAYDRARVAQVLSRGYASLGSMIGTFLQNDALANRYLEWAAALAEQSGDRLARAWVNHVGGYYKNNRGIWDGASADLDAAREVYAACGDRRRLEEVLSISALGAYFRGDLDSCERLCNAHIESALHRRDIQSLGLARCIRTFAMLGRQRLDLAETDLAAVLNAAAGELPTPTRAHASGLAAEVAFRRGDFARARALAESVWEMAHFGMSNPLVFAGWCRAVEVILRLDSLHRNDASSSRGRRALRRELRRLHNAARTMPVYQALVEYLDGYYAWNKGDARRAAQCWQRSAETARRFGIPYEEGRALVQCARSGMLEKSVADEYLKKAEGIFEQIGMVYDLEDLRAGA